MQVYCEILVGSTDVDPYPDLTNFNKLVALLPEAKSGYNFRTRLSIEDSRIQQIVDFLRALGKEPKTSYVGELKPNQFQMLYWREYDRTDYEAAEFLQPEPEVSFFFSSSRLGNGVLQVGANALRKRFTLATADGGLVVTEKARQKMIEAKLVGLVFKPLAITGRNADLCHGTAWELATDVVLPPLAPCCRLVDVHGRPFTGNLDYGLALDGSPYSFAEKHYFRSAISKMPPFDLARTHEVFGYKKGWSPGLVVSRQFYGFCMKHKIPMKWVPVRIDTD